MSSFWTNLKKPILALAPMEGVTDEAFRLTCKHGGADVVYTEFVSSDALKYEAKKALSKLRYADQERPVVAQIFGHDPIAFAAAAKRIEALGFDGLDINFGCPARKVVGSGSGVALLRDPAFARQLVLAALESTSLPISIKIRASIRKERVRVNPHDETRVTAVDFLSAMNDLPIAAVMVHGRSAEDGHTGTVDTDMIKRVKAAFNGVVIANGGIKTAADVPALLTATSADGVGIARGAWGQPWIFSEARGLLTTGQPTIIDWSTRRALIAEHAELLWGAKGAQGMLEFRKHFAYYISGFRGAAELRRRAVQTTSLAEVEALLGDLDRVQT